jgi:GNAT superfamily N-acetyltransferase
MPLAYRRARAADLPFLVGVMADADVTGTIAAWSEADAPAYSRALAAIDADPNQELYVAEADGRPVGTFQLSFVPGIMRRGMWRGLIEGVFIEAGARNRGYGTQMMRWAITRCRERGCGLVSLTSNKVRPDAHRFYLRLGFAQTHEGFKLYL